MYTDWELALAQGGFSEAEKRGFIAEISGEGDEYMVDYAAHIKTWLPIVFEMRKIGPLKRMLEVDNVFVQPDNPTGTIEILDLSKEEKEFPIFSAFAGKFG